MVGITYYREYHRVTVKGHASSGELGKDLVCAAVSALTHTLAANVRQLALQGAIRDHDIQISSGCAEISCNPVARYTSTVELVLDSVCIGFKVLAARYPEYLDYQVR